MAENSRTAKKARVAAPSAPADPQSSAAATSIGDAGTEEIRGHEAGAHHGAHAGSDIKRATDLVQGMGVKEEHVVDAMFAVASGDSKSAALLCAAKTDHRRRQVLGRLMAMDENELFV